MSRQLYMNNMKEYDNMVVEFQDKNNRDTTTTTMMKRLYFVIFNNPIVCNDTLKLTPSTPPQQQQQQQRNSHFLFIKNKKRKQQDEHKKQQRQRTIVVQPQQQRYKPLLLFHLQQQVQLVVMVFVILMILDRTIVVSASPYILLRSKSPKCFLVTAPHPTEVVVFQYKIPDLVIVPENAGSLDSDGKIVGGGNGTTTTDGMDTMYNERLQKRMEALKMAHLKDIHFIVSPRDIDGGMIKNTRRDTNGDILPRRIRHPIDDDQLFGEFTMQIDEQDYYLEICIQSYTATYESPSRVSLSITTPEQLQYEEQYGKHIASQYTFKELQKHQYQLEQHRSQYELLHDTIMENKKIVNEHTSRISAELSRMCKRLEQMESETYISIEHENEFHKKSIELHKAVKYYPIMRILIILMAGMMQVHYVVEFMKSKHIY